MLYKYIQLSLDIRRYLDMSGKLTFTTRCIFDAINKRKGFYSYSYSTLSHAIDYLIDYKYVVAGRSDNRSGYVFSYVPNIVRYSEQSDEVRS